MDAPRATTPPPMLVPTPPDAPQRIGTRTARKRARAEDEAEDAAWLNGGGAMPREGSPAKLTCSAAKDNEVAPVRSVTQPASMKPTPTAAKRPPVDPLTKYTPIAIKRLDSTDDPWMDRLVPATEPKGKPA